MAGDGIPTQRANWVFDERVAQKFDAHVLKSIPSYAEIQKLIFEFSDWFISDGSTVVDLGCATGTTIAGLQQRHSTKKVNYIGVDRSEAMLEQVPPQLSGKFVAADILEWDIPPADMIAALFTIQFIDPCRRAEIVQRVYDSLKPRGIFFLAEKVMDDDSVLTDIYIQVHWASKVDSGFDPAEIFGKAKALRGVLTPLSLRDNHYLLTDAGFTRISIVSKWCNFVLIAAIK